MKDATKTFIVKTAAYASRLLKYSKKKNIRLTQAFMILGLKRISKLHTRTLRLTNEIEIIKDSINKHRS